MPLIIVADETPIAQHDPSLARYPFSAFLRPGPPRAPVGPVLESLKLDQLFEPLIVVAHDNGRLEIVDGVRRWWALREMITSGEPDWYGHVWTRDSLIPVVVLNDGH